MTPGIHSLSFEQYHSAAGVSNSMLRILSERTPAHLRAAITGEKPEPTPAQRFGAILHRCIFEPDTVRDAFHVKPVDVKFTTKEGKAWQEAHADRPVLTEQESGTILAMVAAIHAHPVAGRLLKNATFEQGIFAEDSHGTLRKARVDILPTGGNILPDLKTCECAAPDAFEKHVGNFGYYRQGAFYLDVCKLAGREFEAFVLIAAEKTPPYAIACYRVDPMAINLGRLQYERDLAIYRECVESGKWPGYPEKITCISVPQWMQRALENV